MKNSDLIPGFFQQNSEGKIYGFMCGICGILNFKGSSGNPSAIQGMIQAMAHRGPDATNYYSGEEIVLGHLRLSIVDLSTAANQPFIDNSSRYILVFNGEIYNYREVKALLHDYEFHTTSDTEVIIAAYAKWGPDCIRHFRGMFAFAIWDRQEKELFMVRDRMGVKPLYYYLNDEQLVFASEIRAILTVDGVKRKLNPDALSEYFSYQSVGGSASIIEGIQQLEAGWWMKIRAGKKEKKVYWDLANSAVTNDHADKRQIQLRIKELMLQSVQRRLVSDVPVGAFLSGGIDSSAVVGLMAEASAARPYTFTASFDEKEYDESSYADIVAKKFNTVHTKMLLKPTVFLDEMENALQAMDTPSGDGINIYVVSKAIRQNGMTVALSGIGGDELFAGYPFFDQFLQLQRSNWLWKTPISLRKWATGVLPAVQGKKERILQLLQLPSPSIDNVYPVFRQLLSPRSLERLTSLSVFSELRQELAAKKKDLLRLPLLSQVSAAEYLGYTQHTLLKDTDQMSMAVSLEVREPFFDQDLVEFVLGVPDHLKKPVYPKSLLVDSLKPLLPDEIVFRKKQGFLFPWDLWLRNELKTFADRHIKNMAQRSFINGQALTNYWQRFLAGDKNIRWAEIWVFVVLEYWLEKNSVS